MKQLLILIFSILSSCVHNKSDKTQSEFKSSTDITMGSDNIHSKKKKDTIHNYWALILDTISSKEEFKISELISD